MGHVPVIDLSGPQNEVVKAVEHACSSSGFFLIRNHGVPEDVIAQQFEENRKFFALPEEEKAKIKVNEINRCWQEQTGGFVNASSACFCMRGTQLHNSASSRYLQGLEPDAAGVAGPDKPERGRHEGGPVLRARSAGAQGGE